MPPILHGVIREGRWPFSATGSDHSWPQVGTRGARKAIDESFSRILSRTSYWLDLGNNAASGQYVLGQPLNARNRRKAGRLRTVSELYPEIIDADASEDPLPSCSALEALDRQEPFINQTIAASALAMLAQLFRYGKLAHHGAFFNAKTGQMCALPIDPVLWKKLRNAQEKGFPATKFIDVATRDLRA